MKPFGLFPADAESIEGFLVSFFRRISYPLWLLGWGFLTGCASLRGPSLEVTAPMISGRVVRADTGEPIAGARVDRRIVSLRQPTGGFRKGAETMMLLQDEERTTSDGRFSLPTRKVALLFSIGERPLDLGLVIRRTGFLPWQTNYTLKALVKDPNEVRISAGDIRLALRGSIRSQAAPVSSTPSVR